jgi:integrase
MGVKSYQKEIAPGKVETFYMVVAEAINRYTGLRIQKKRRGIPSKPKALHVYKELWSMCREERPDGVDFQNWGELVDRYLIHLNNKIRSPENPMGFSPHVVRTKCSRIKHLRVWDTTHLDLISPQFVSDCLDKMESSGASRMHTNHLLKEVKCIFSYALQLGALKANPFAGFKMRKVPKKRKEALTHGEANKLIAESKIKGHPYYYIWLLTIALGLRRSELAGLKWLDIDFDQALIYLRRQMIPGEGIVESLKDREERVVAIPKHVLPVLKEMKLKSSSEFVVENDDHQWTSGGQAKVLREFCKVIGIKEVTHHQLRATHITLALVDGIPLGIVKENVGHAKLSTTDEYFRSAGINMKGQTDGLRIHVPSEGEAEVIPLNRV